MAAVATFILVAFVDPTIGLGDPHVIELRCLKVRSSEAKLGVSQSDLSDASRIKASLEFETFQGCSALEFFGAQLELGSVLEPG